MMRRLFSITFLIALPLVSVFAQQKPDFSGTWKLNVAKSDFGALPGPQSRTDVITHKDPSLSDSATVESAEGKQQYTANFTTDGKEVTNQISGREVKATMKWAGNNLAVVSKLVYNETDVIGNSTWELSADGKTFTISIHYASSMGETDQKLVFEKQPGAAEAVPAKKP